MVRRAWGKLTLNSQEIRVDAPGLKQLKKQDTLPYGRGDKQICAEHIYGTVVIRLGLSHAGIPFSTSLDGPHVPL